MGAMIPLLSFLFALAGFRFCFYRRRRYLAIEKPESSKVVVQGQTYSDTVKEVTCVPVRIRKVENVQHACVVGAGYVGGLSAVVLAKQNPNVQFYVVDSDPRLIAAWNSDKLPLAEPGLEDIFFEQTSDEPPSPRSITSEMPLYMPGSMDELIDKTPLSRRVRKIRNITFSTNVHAGITAADMVFLCSGVSGGVENIEDENLSTTEMNRVIQAIAQVSTGHKIIVQKGAAPYGSIGMIKKLLKETASPSASFDVLSNPDFLLPGSALQDLLSPQRVIIGHILDESMSAEGLTALKRLYTPWVAEHRLVTMDAWSSELGKIAANALLAQQMSSLNSLDVICQSTNADIGHVVQSLGLNRQTGPTDGGEVFHRDVQCLVFLARELSLHEVADYWKCVLRMRRYCISRIAEQVIKRIPRDTNNMRVAVIGFAGGMTQGSNAVEQFARRLSDSGIEVTIYDPWLPVIQSKQNRYSVDTNTGKVTWAESLEDACRGCNAICQFAHIPSIGDTLRWQGISHEMQDPKVFLDLGSTIDQSKMQLLGFETMESSMW